MKNVNKLLKIYAYDGRIIGDKTTKIKIFIDTRRKNENTFKKWSSY